MRTWITKLAHQVLHHFHEVAPAIVVEASHLNLAILLAIVGTLLLVFAIQLAFLPEGGV